jgi:hypothetical protein
MELPRLAAFSLHIASGLPDTSRSLPIGDGITSEGARQTRTAWKCETCATLGTSSANASTSPGVLKNSGYRALNVPQPGVFQTMRTLPPSVKTTLLFGLFLAGTALLLSPRVPASGPPDRVPRGNLSPRALELDDALKKVVRFSGFDDPKTSVTEVVDQLEKRYDLTIEVDEAAFKAAGIPDIMRFQLAENAPIPPRPWPLDAILRKILSRIPSKSPARYVIRDFFIELTTEAALRTEMRKKPQDLFLPLVLASFNKAPLNEALEQLAQQANFNIVLDGRVGDKATQPVSSVFVNVTLDTAVRLLADMADLQPILIENVLYVTSPENAARLEKERGIK